MLVKSSLKDSFVAKKYGVKSVSYSNKYKKDREAYADYENKIASLEIEIISEKEKRKCHTPAGKEHNLYSEYLHANITENLRLMYLVVDRVLIFEEIITKNYYDATKKRK